MRETHTITAPKPDAPPRMRDGLPADKWLPLAEVAAAVAAGAGLWPKRREVGHG